MSPGAAKPFRQRLFCITMLSPGAAWQCAVIPRRFQVTATVYLADRYEGTVRQWKCSFPRKYMRQKSPTDIPEITAPAFRLRSSIDKGSLYLSGSIETEVSGNLLWDVRLSNVYNENEWMFSLAEGRLELPENEYLFPAASSFLLIDRNMTDSIAAGCARNPLRAFCAGEAKNGAIIDGLKRKCLAQTGFIESDPNTILMQSSEFPDPLCFEPSDTDAGLRFLLKLQGGHLAETRFGSWSCPWSTAEIRLPGFMISVI